MPGRAKAGAGSPLPLSRAKAGGAGEIRTPDTQFRKLLLYPSELQPRMFLILIRSRPGGLLTLRRPGLDPGQAQI
jgi:hypothetical protein